MERLKELIITVLSTPPESKHCSCGCDGCKEKIPGGLAQGMSPQDIAKIHNVGLDQIRNSLEKGIKVELEHTTSIGIASEIALDHLYEDINYYDKLEKMESDD